jgi:hypothetical protein
MQMGPIRTPVIMRGSGIKGLWTMPNFLFWVRLIFLNCVVTYYLLSW